MARLIPSAHWSPAKSRQLGDSGQDKDWNLIADSFRRNDPHGDKGRKLLKQLTAKSTKTPH